MTATYTTVERIASLLQYTELNDDSDTQIRKVFDGDSLPTEDEVNELIEEVEDDIDLYCKRSWKLNTKQNEYHHYRSRGFRGRYYDRSGYPVFAFKLKHNYVRAFDTAQGDKIEAWDGDNWIDFVADKVLGDAMYDEDYWIDYEINTRIYMFNHFPREGQKTIRASYRYGELTVPSGIKLATSLLVAAQINERYEMYKEVSKDTSPAMNQSEKWELKAYKKLDEYAINKECEVI